MRAIKLGKERERGWQHNRGVRGLKGDMCAKHGVKGG